MSRSYSGLLGPNVSTMTSRAGRTSSCEARALSRSHSYRRNQRSALSSVKAWGGVVLTSPALGQRSSQCLPSVSTPTRTPLPAASDWVR